MSERHTMLGQRADLTSKRQRLIVECEALRDRLRTCLPNHENVKALHGENIVNTAIALQANLAELAAVQYQIDVLNDNLGM